MEAVTGEQAQQISQQWYQYKPRIITNTIDELEEAENSTLQTGSISELSSQEDIRDLGSETPDEMDNLDEDEFEGRR